jgi:hypothetical protein
MIIISVFILICFAGFFDYMMDGIKDYGKSDKFWFWRKIKGTKYEAWGTYGSHISLWGAYNPAYPWSSDGWHFFKHCLMISFAGACAVLATYAIYLRTGLHWYFDVPICLVIWWSVYRIEAFIFSWGYNKLK